MPSRQFVADSNPPKITTPIRIATPPNINTASTTLGSFDKEPLYNSIVATRPEFLWRFDEDPASGILLSPALLRGLTAEALEMVLVHELVHVRRLENAINLLQRIVEFLSFCQPLV
jgi:Zn-dependent protease with chaperone function